MQDEKDKETLYPYLVVRLMATVYVRVKVEFVEQGVCELTNNRFVIEFPNAFKDGVLDKEAIDLAVQFLKVATAKSRLRMCLVLAPDHCIFVEPDGTINESMEPPSGGLQIDANKQRVA